MTDVEESQENKVNVIEVLEPQEGEFPLPCADGSVKRGGKGHEVRTSDQLQQDSERGEEHHSERHRETDDPDPEEQQEQDNLVARHCIWSISENHMRHHVQESVKLLWWTKR